MSQFPGKMYCGLFLYSILRKPCANIDTTAVNQTASNCDRFALDQEVKLNLFIKSVRYSYFIVHLSLHTPLALSVSLSRSVTAVDFISHNVKKGPLKRIVQQREGKCLSV
uniref:Uncharacterized protein n=1 Tax=Arion vulgaris TaxID=1028688 RepID=A0A0B7AXN3_9EUPU